MKADPRIAVTLLALAAAGVGTQASWWTVSWSPDLGPAGSVGLAGGAGTGGLAGVLPAVVLASMLATLTLRTVGRRTVGLLAAVCGAGMAVLGFAPPEPGRDVVEQAVRTATLSSDLALAATGVSIAYGVIGVLVVAASAWLVRRPPAARRRPDGGDQTSEVTDALSSWKAMDEGRDPTQPEGDRS